MMAPVQQTAYNIRVFHEGGEAAFACFKDQSVLTAMEKAGLAVVPVGCRGGGCGICKIAIEDGDFRAGKMSKAHVSDEELSRGNRALACRVFPESDLSIRPIGKLFKNFHPSVRPSRDGAVATTKEG